MEKNVVEIIHRVTWIKWMDKDHFYFTMHVSVQMKVQTEDFRHVAGESCSSGKWPVSARLQLADGVSLDSTDWVAVGWF